MSNTKRGFTLIELLVVIAIIGVLASVVLASLNTARNKGADAAIKANINGIRSQAELFYDSNASSYLPSSGSAVGAPTDCSTVYGATTNMMGADTNIKNALIAARTNSNSNDTACINTGTAWAVAVELKTTDGTGSAADVYCVDSTGQSKAYSYTGTQAAATAALDDSNDRCA